ncbi:MAG: TonB family protein [Sandaracinaceae bacterium]
MSSALSIGAVFATDFRVERLLGEGGMGAVYQVEQLSTGKRRALKTMHPNLVPDEKSRARFVDEAKVGARIESDHVVDVLSAGVDDASGIPWLAMELLEGEDFEKLSQRRGPLPPSEVLDLMEQAGHAIGAAHAAGVIHRDLKPENLFLANTQSRDGRPVVKVLDFGIARMVESSRASATVTSAIGSPLWMAPEQAQPGEKLTPATDVWALGLIAFSLLTGKSYWSAANHPTFNLPALLIEVMTYPIAPASQRAAEIQSHAALPPGFDAWFARCVDREPSARFPDARAAVAALRSVLTSPAFAFAPTMESPAATSVPGVDTARGHGDPSVASFGAAPSSLRGTAPLVGGAPASHPASAARAAARPDTTGRWLIIAAGAVVASLLVAAVFIAGLTFLLRRDEPVAAAAPQPPQPAVPTAPDPNPVMAPIAPRPGEPDPPRVPREPSAEETPASSEADAQALDERQLAQRIEDRRARGQTAAAHRDMQVYVRRFPGAARSRSYQAILARTGGAPAPPPTSPAPTGSVRTGSSQTSGGLSAEVIRRVVRARQPELMHCYDQGRAAHPGIEGRVVLRLEIAASGAVRSAQIANTTLNDPSTERCMVAAAQRWAFPSANGPTAVSYPVIFAAQ